MRPVNLLIVICFIGLVLLQLWWLALNILPMYFLILAVLSLSVPGAICYPDRRWLRYPAYFICSLFMLCGVLFITMMVSTFFNHEYDSLSPIILASLGVLGAISFFSLRRQHPSS
ncbi:MAG: hypothetical protein GJ680_05300 [Alteromonadaceae bacterium]|nr:hypothetical protein [Alteromonadaceae bacterium]